MDATIFYSWQSDAPEDDCRYFIRDALKRAVKLLKRDDEVFASPRLDHDTKDQAGMPGIAATILGKVSESAVFVADLTLIARAKDKKCPNPNVTLELGYAGAQIGWPRLIGVMNSDPEYGTAKELIFDLVHKRHPFEYSLSGAADRNAVREDLAQRLAEAIKACLAEAHVQAERTVARLDKQTCHFLLAAGKSEFFSLNDEEKHQFQVIRILDLGILRFDQSAKEKKYAYHWTYLGRLVLEKLGVEKELPAPVEAPAPAAAPMTTENPSAAGPAAGREHPARP